MEQSSINSALDLLVGTQVRLWPYLRGAGYPRGILGQLWMVMEEAGDAARVFWGNAEPAETKMDLPGFCAFMSDPSRTLLFVTSVNGESILGAIWFDERIGHRAFGSIYMVPSARGAQALEAVTLAAHYGHTILEIEQIWALTPWKEAGQLIAGGGFTRMAILPGFAQVEGILYDVMVYRKVRD